MAEAKRPLRGLKQIHRTEISTVIIIFADKDLSVVTKCNTDVATASKTLSQIVWGRQSNSKYERQREEPALDQAFRVLQR
jgi:hypothetical protein